MAPEAPRAMAIVSGMQIDFLSPYALLQATARCTFWGRQSLQPGEDK